MNEEYIKKIALDVWCDSNSYHVEEAEQKVAEIIRQVISDTKKACKKAIKESYTDSVRDHMLNTNEILQRIDKAEIE